MQRIHDFAVDVELELLGSCVADAYRRSTVVSWQPAQLGLVQAALSRDAVQRLQILMPSGRGAQQPFAPGGSLVLVAGGQQRVERNRSVAQPAEPVIPIAHAARLLRQRSRGRGDD